MAMLSSFFLQRPAAPDGAGIRELARVRLVEEFLAEGYVLPEGAEGTVVLEHGKGEAFEVEFTTPFHAVVGVPADLLRPISP